VVLASSAGGSGEARAAPKFSFPDWRATRRSDSRVIASQPWFASAAIGASIPIYEGGALRRKEDRNGAGAGGRRYGSVVLNAFRE
jgi:hypothetical protein